MVFSNRSNATSIYKNSISELSLKTYVTDYFTYNHEGKEEPTSGAHIQNFKIGDMTSLAADLFVVNTEEKAEHDIWGVVSTSFFPGKVIDYDYANRKINLFSESYCASKSLAYWNEKTPPVELEKKDLATFSGTIDGKPIRIQIDSARRLSTINDTGVKLANLPLQDYSKQVSGSGNTNGGR